MFERFYLLSQLRRYEGSIEHTAQHAGVPIEQVRSLMKRHGIDRIWPVRLPRRAASLRLVPARKRE